MTDPASLVERLRERAEHVDELERSGEQLPQRLVQILREAADEIERLREIVRLYELQLAVMR
jgi:hypothetical protein